MGTWGVGPFDNDDASELLGDLDASADPSVELRADIAYAVDADGYLEASDSSLAIAAAAVVAAHACRYPDDTLRGWRHEPFASSSLTTEAREAVADLAIEPQAIAELAPLSAVAGRARFVSHPADLEVAKDGRRRASPPVGAGGHSSTLDTDDLEAARVR